MVVSVAVLAKLAPYCSTSWSAQGPRAGVSPMFLTVNVMAVATPGTVSAGSVTAVTTRSGEGCASISRVVKASPVSLPVRPPSNAAALAFVTTST